MPVSDFGVPPTAEKKNEIQHLSPSAPINDETKNDKPVAEVQRVLETRTSFFTEGDSLIPGWYISHDSRDF